MNVRHALITLVMIAVAGHAGAEPMPHIVPVPTPRPDAVASPQAPTAPDGAKAEDDQSAPDVQLPANDTVPVPAAKAPQMQPPSKDQAYPAPPASSQPDEKAKTEEPEKPAALPPEKEDPAAYATCISALKQEGAQFTEEQGFDEGGGCGIDKPVVVREILPGIKLEPEAKVRCEAALALSRWAKQTVLPAASMAFGPDRTIVTVRQANAYSCRNRNGASDGKLSEHARGNAIDIAGFGFSDKSSYEIKPRTRDSSMDGAFERAIIATGCLYFSTVLGPESDEAHQTHIHLDILSRKGGYRYCW
jgi:hypothetical protein